MIAIKKIVLFMFNFWYSFVGLGTLEQNCHVMVWLIVV